MGIMTFWYTFPNVHIKIIAWVINNSHYDEEVSYATFGEKCDLETEGNSVQIDNEFFYKFHSQFKVFEQDRDVSLSRDKLNMIKLIVIHSGLFKGGFTARALCWSTDLPLLQ